MRKKQWVILTALVLMLAVAFAGCGGQGSGSTETDQSAAGGTLTEFAAKTLDGKDYTAEDLAKADVTMINVWATFCGPCIQEMPEIASLEKRLPDNVSLITCCVDYAEETDADCRSILKDAGYEGTTLVSFEGDLEKVLGSTAYVPTTFFFDSEGNQVGEAVIGAPGDPEKDYLKGINDALAASGKGAVQLK